MLVPQEPLSKQEESREIRHTVAGLARGGLAATVCDHLDWRSAAGRVGGSTDVFRVFSLDHASLIVSQSRLQDQPPVASHEHAFLLCEQYRKTMRFYEPSNRAQGNIQVGDDVVGMLQPDGKANAARVDV